MRPKRCGTCSIRWDATGHVCYRPGNAEQSRLESLLFPHGTPDGGRPRRRRTPGPRRTEPCRYAGCTDCEVNGGFPAASTLLAVESLQDAIRMAHEAGFPDPESETLLALARFHLKQLPAAREEALRLSAGQTRRTFRWPNSGTLSETPNRRPYMPKQPTGTPGPTASHTSEDTPWTAQKPCWGNWAKISPHCPPTIPPSTREIPGKTKSPPRSRNSENRHSPRHSHEQSRLPAQAAPRIA